MSGVTSALTAVFGKQNNTCFADCRSLELRKKILSKEKKAFQHILENINP
jgi:hypothetical protein